eukprot:gene26508-32527_t
MSHRVKDGLEELATASGVLAMEDARYMFSLKKEQTEEFAHKMNLFAQDAGWCRLKQVDGLHATHHIHTRFPVVEAARAPVLPPYESREKKAPKKEDEKADVSIEEPVEEPKEETLGENLTPKVEMLSVNDPQNTSGEAAEK